MARSKGKPCPKGKRVRRQPQPLELFKFGLNDEIFIDNLYGHLAVKAQASAYPRFPYPDNVKKSERQYILRVFKEEGYRIKSVAGKGTMAHVWRAIAPDGNKVVIKITQDLTDAAAFAYVLKQKPKNPILPKVYCVGTLGFAKRRFYYIVMEQLWPVDWFRNRCTADIISKLLMLYDEGEAKASKMLRKQRTPEERNREALSWIARNRKEKIWGKEKKNITNLLQGVVQLTRAGFLLGDFHDGQFLFTKAGDIKMIDLGLSQHKKLSPMTDLGCVIDPGVAYLDLVVASAVQVTK
jgi:hypothetical protein